MAPFFLTYLFVILLSIVSALVLQFHEAFSIEYFGRESPLKYVGTSIEEQRKLLFNIQVLILICFIVIPHIFVLFFEILTYNRFNYSIVLLLIRVGLFNELIFLGNFHYLQSFYHMFKREQVDQTFYPVAFVFVISFSPIFTNVQNGIALCVLQIDLSNTLMQMLCIIDSFKVFFQRKPEQLSCLLKIERRIQAEKKGLNKLFIGLQIIFLLRSILSYQADFATYFYSLVLFPLYIHLI